MALATKYALNEHNISILNAVLVTALSDTRLELRIVRYDKQKKRVKVMYNIPHVGNLFGYIVEDDANLKSMFNIGLHRDAKLDDIIHAINDAWITHHDGPLVSLLGHKFTEEIIDGCPDCGAENKLRGHNDCTGTTRI